MINDADYWTNIVTEAIRGKGEYNFLDFKLKISSDKNRLKEHINAFGNLERGGCFVFGVENFIPVGLQQSQDDIIKKISDLATKTQEPSLQVNAFPITIDKIRLLCIHIMPGLTRPVFIKDKPPLSGKGCFKRTGSSTIPMAISEIRDLLAISDNYYYDESPVKNANIEVLELENFYKIYSNIDKNSNVHSQKMSSILKDYRILISINSNIHATVAGWLCFSKEPQSIREFRNAYIEIQLYKGIARNSPIKKYEIRGNLPEQIEQAIDILQQNIWTIPKIIGTIRQDIPAYSIVALREIITNSVVHRDYKQMHQPVKIAIFNNRIEVENPGSLMPGLTILNIIHKRDWRNPLIAELMKKFGYGEMDGQGIDRIYHAILQIKVPPPIFISNNRSFTVILSAPKEYEDFTAEEKKTMIIILTIMQEKIDNKVVRDCFNISSSQASTLIKAMVSSKVLESCVGSRKYAKYSLSEGYREKIFG